MLCNLHREITFGLSRISCFLLFSFDLFLKGSKLEAKDLHEGGLCSRRGFALEQAILMKTVHEYFQFLDRRSCVTIATDWFIDGCLQWCLMYSRDFLCFKSKHIQGPG